MKRLAFLTAALAMLSGARLHAEPSVERNPLDVGLKAGVSQGNVYRQDKKVGTYGGFPIIAGVNFVISRRFTFEVAVNFVADFGNFQVTRLGIDAQLAFHLLGGARRTFTDYGNILVVTRDPYNVSLLLRQGLQHYTIPNLPLPEDPSDPTDTTLVPTTISGSNLATHAGLEFRYDLNDSISVSLDVYLPVYTLPAGEERLKATVTEFIGAVRFFL